jgi:hypothetical protein
MSNDQAPQTTREIRLEGALRNLLLLLELVPYRDPVGLRLGPGVPHFDHAKEALGDG